MSYLEHRDAHSLHSTRALAAWISADISALPDSEEVCHTREQLTRLVREHDGEIERRAELARTVADASREGVRVI